MFVLKPIRIRDINRGHFDWVSQNQNQTNYKTQSEKWRIFQATDSKLKASIRCSWNAGECKGLQSRTTFVLHLIGWESDARFLKTVTDLSDAKPRLLSPIYWKSLYRVHCPIFVVMIVATKRYVSPWKKRYLGTQKSYHIDYLRYGGHRCNHEFD